MVIDALPGTAKIQFCFGALGIEFTQDEVTKVQCGSQAEVKGVKPGWKIMLVNGNEMSNNADIRPALDRCRKSGLKYFIHFSKPAAEMQAEQAMQQAQEAKKRNEQLARDREEKAKKQEQEKQDQAKDAEKAKKKEEADARAAATAAKSGGGGGFMKPKEVAQPAARAEEDAKKIVEGDSITLKYYQYTEQFAIADGKIAVKDIDDFFGLSGVMAGCGIHLGDKEPEYEKDNVYLKEEPIGTVVDLKPGETYWIFAVQDPEQEKKDVARNKAIWAGVPPEAAARGEGCSCVYGSPCTDQYVCLDWENRMAVAKKNGMLPLA